MGHLPGQPNSYLEAHLGLLVCPVCHGRLRVVAEAIDCLECGRRYPIVDGLPVLIPSRAKTRDQIA